MSSWQPDQFRMAGGLNEEDPAFTQPAGSLAYCANYEVLAGGGYRRIDGYERYDGRASPSAATYAWLTFWGGGQLPFAIGDVITGGSSGATATVCYAPALQPFNENTGQLGGTPGDSGILGTGTQGDWIKNQANGTLVVTALTGHFTADETITSTLTKVAIVLAKDSSASIGDTNFKIWLGAARDYYRSLIQPVGTTDYPGVGPVLGGFVLNDSVYAIRVSATQTGGGGFDIAIISNGIKMYKASGSGWAVVDLGSYIRFQNGTIEINEGDTITGGSSGATAVVARVNVGSGNWAGPTYTTGRLAVNTITGVFTDGENLQVSAVTCAAAIGTTKPNYLETGPAITDVEDADRASRYNTTLYNFYGASDWRRTYGCNGVNRAWEFDGTVFCFIETGMVVDAPTFVEAHRNNLFLAFPGGSLQNSATGLPLTWSARLGAAELGLGDEITGIRSNGNNTLAVTCLKTTQVVQGTSDLDWSLRSISNEIGSISNTIQEAGGQTVFLDRAGVNVVIPAPFAYQDLSTQAISRNVRKSIERTAMNVVGSSHAINKSQYRLFFNDMTALVATFFGTKLMGWMRSRYAHQGSVWFNGPIHGVETMFMGTDVGVGEGYVMQLDTGTSFDGLPIQSIIKTPYNYHKSPNRDKRFHKVTLEVDTPASIDLLLKTEFEYGNTTQAGSYDNQSALVGGQWDIATWDRFFWDSAQLSSPEINIDGVGRNISLTIYHNDAVDAPFIVSAAMVDFSIWGIKR